MKDTGDFRVYLESGSTENPREILQRDLGRQGIRALSVAYYGAQLVWSSGEGRWEMEHVFRVEYEIGHKEKRI